MPTPYTVDDLINSIKVRAAIPIAQNVFEESDLLRFANEEMSLKIVPAIMRVKEEYYVRNMDLTIEANTVEYPIPYRAIGNKLRDVSVLNNTGGIWHLARIQPDQLDAFQPSFSSGLSANRGFYLQNDSIILVQDITGLIGQTLRLKYYLKPNDLVAADRVGVITNINTGTNTVTLEAWPSANIVVGSTMDFISAMPIYKTRSYDIEVTGINMPQRTITLTELPSGLKIGDTISLAGETKIPQIPTELQAMLAQAVACRCLESLGATQELATANAKLTEMEQQILALIDTRTEGNPQKILNLTSFLRQTSMNYRRGTGSY